MSVWFVTGASRGLGRALTASALAHGDQVAAAARDPRRVVEAFPDAGDALCRYRWTSRVPSRPTRRSPPRSSGAAGSTYWSTTPGTDSSARSRRSPTPGARTVRHQCVRGAQRHPRRAADAARAGRIVNIGSSARFVSSAGQGLYSASKAALEATTEALHAELAPLGVHVTVVEPGSFRTEFLTPASRRGSNVEIAAYATSVGALRSAIAAGDGHQPGDPTKAVAALRELATTADPPLRLQLGSDCVSLVEGKLAAVAEELDQWRELAVSTDFS